MIDPGAVHVTETIAHPIPILIAGAGIAGLTAALSLAQHGRAVTVIEAFDAPSEVGAGLQVPPNACHVLGQLGVLDALTAKATRPDRICLGDAIEGRIVLAMDVNAGTAGSGIYLTAHRASLHGVLYTAAKSDPNITMLEGHRIVDASEGEDGVHITAAHLGESAQLHAGVVIAADGIWSILRKAVPGALAPKPTGRIAMRAVVPAPAEAQSNAVIAWMAPDCHLVTYPVRKAETRNLVAIVPGSATGQSWSEGVDTDRLNALVAMLANTPYGQIMKKADWTAWPLYAVAPESSWFSNRIALIGDAAHGIEPFAAQGAAMAIEDGYVIGKMIGEASAEPQAIFAAFEQARRDRVRKVAKRTDLNRFAYHQSGVGRIARNLTFKMRGPSALRDDLAWLYDYRA